ncbi:MAG: 2-hydroxyacyl-CoA dehydratase family protein [Deltaproteobacteria bacterium]|jgi:benzoyl-CoA reductase/2-hydroxyglutaryl-CoA dehydratase subunit BcrC/BadD/HgdB|nr:2-hydroxyacyl-CoA dehydratase family protein [Deltaproteobacteria bacterium]
MANSDDRLARALARARDKRDAESQLEIKKLREREDFIPEYGYFLDLYEDRSIKAIESRVGMPVALLLCLQAPVELFLAQGFFPVKIYSGSYSASNLTGARLPALMCPTLKAVLGVTEMEPELVKAPWVIPLTCDWIVRFKETRELFGGFDAKVLELEVPRLKDGPLSSELWLAEVWNLSRFLIDAGGAKLKASKLLSAIKRVEKVRALHVNLTQLRREGLIAPLWYTLVLSAFYYDLAEPYCSALTSLISALSKSGKVKEDAPGVFLTGSPIYFPNFKIYHLLEQAGLMVLGDDLCSSERLLPRHVEVSDRSERGLLRSLSETYHQGCLCPVFADNVHRAAIMREAVMGADVRGVVFHLLKGCHPYDLDSFLLEDAVHDWGLKFLKIETDYSLEDSQNLLTRLEAFRATLEVKRAV